MVGMLMSSEFDEEVTNFFKYYQDRGMKKWAGYFLSDHTMKMNHKQAAEAEADSRKLEAAMPLTEIGSILLTAFADHYPVRLQLKEIEADGQLPAEITGLVVGWHEQSVMINDHAVPLEQINHVKLLKDGG
jgi:hypothetical protein